MTTLTRRQPMEARPTRPLYALIGQQISRGLSLLMVWQQRYVERRKLLTMSDRMLKDIGLSRADIEREANKPFWRL